MFCKGLDSFTPILYRKSHQKSSYNSSQNNVPFQGLYGAKRYPYSTFDVERSMFDVKLFHLKLRPSFHNTWKIQTQARSFEIGLPINRDFLFDPLNIRENFFVENYCLLDVSLKFL